MKAHVQNCYFDNILSDTEQNAKFTTGKCGRFDVG